MASSTKKSLLFSLETDLDRAKREAESLAHAMKEQKFAEAEAKAGGDKHKLSLIQQQRTLAQLKEEQKRASQALKQHTALQKEAQAGGKSLLGSIGDLKAGYLVLAAAAMKVVGSFKNLINDGIAYTGTVRGVEVEVGNLSRATDGMIKDAVLSRLAEFQKKLNLSGLETESLAKLSVEYSRVNKITFDQGMQFVTNALQSGKTKGLEPWIGALKLSGDLTQKQNQLLDRVTKAMNGVTIAAGNAAEAQDKWKNSNDRFSASIGTFITDVVGLDKVYVSLAEHLDLLSAKSRKAMANTTGAALEAQTAIVDGLKKRIIEQQKDIEGNWGSPATLAKQKNEYVKTTKEIEKAEKELYALKKKYALETVEDQKYYGAGAISLSRNIEEHKVKTVKAGASSRMKAAKDEFDFHVKLFNTDEKRQKKHLENQLKLEKKYVSDKQKLFDRYFADQAKTHNDWAKQDSETAKKYAEDTRASITQTTEAILSTTLANVASARSAGEFFTSMANAGLDAIRNLAIGEAAKEMALALGAQGVTWGVPNPSSVNHWASFGVWTGIATGMAVGANVLSSAASGGGGYGSSSSSSSAYGSSGGGSSSGYSGGGSQQQQQSSQSGPNHVTNITLKGRTFTSPRELRKFAKLIKGAM